MEEKFKCLAYSEIHKGSFCKCVLRLHLMLSVAALRPLACWENQLTKIGKRQKKIKVSSNASIPTVLRIEFDAFLKLCKNEGHVDVRNMHSDSRKKVIDQNKTRLRDVIKVFEFYGGHERISKKQDGSLVGRTPSFRGEYGQLFIHKICAFLAILITRNFSFS